MRVERGRRRRRRGRRARPRAAGPCAVAVEAVAGEQPAERLERRVELDLGAQRVDAGGELRDGGGEVEAVARARWARRPSRTAPPRARRRGRAGTSVSPSAGGEAHAVDPGLPFGRLGVAAGAEPLGVDDVQRDRPGVGRGEERHGSASGLRPVILASRGGVRQDAIESAEAPPGRRTADAPTRRIGRRSGSPRRAIRRRAGRGAPRRRRSRSRSPAARQRSRSRATRGEGRRGRPAR